MAFTKQKINGRWVVTSVGSVNGVEPDDNGNVELELPYIQESEKGAANGVAPLDEDGKVPTERLPEMNYVPTTRKINGETLDHDLTISGLPDVTSADNGKALTVQNGMWAVGSVITYKEV